MKGIIALLYESDCSFTGKRSEIDVDERMYRKQSANEGSSQVRWDEDFLGGETPPVGRAALRDLESGGSEGALEGLSIST